MMLLTDIDKEGEKLNEQNVLSFVQMKRQVNSNINLRMRINHSIEVNSVSTRNELTI